MFQWPCSDGNARQLWLPQKVHGDVYRFMTSARERLCLALAGNPLAAVLEPCSSSAAQQQWRLQDRIVGRVRTAGSLRNERAGLCLAVRHAATNDGVAVGPETCTGKAHERFSLVSAML